MSAAVAAKTPWRVALIARAATFFLRTLAITWRIRMVNDADVRALRDRREAFIYILWHGHLLPLTWVHRNRQISVIVSEHKDGEILARVMHALGCRTVRGSTSRGAARALLGACRELENGFDLAITPDGPRGPARSVAPGAVIIAQRTGAVMVPVAASADRAWHLRSWDRFIIPKPFARVTVAYGDPIRIAADTARDATTDLDVVRDGIDHAAAIAARGAA
jgi:lysophospholipid acyltransferase (LPLAT)-like uncharacterized protein